MRTPQSPIGSGFGASSTAAEVIDGIDLSGTLAIVTGGYSGIGLETTRALVSAGASVVVPARDREKATNALSAMARVTIESLDLMDSSSIDAFARRFLERAVPLHVLINNAGIMATPLTRWPRLRVAVCDQSLRPFPTDASTLAGPATVSNRARRCPVLGRAQEIRAGF